MFPFLFSSPSSSFQNDLYLDQFVMSLISLQHAEAESQMSKLQNLITSVGPK